MSDSTTMPPGPEGSTGVSNEPPPLTRRERREREAREAAAALAAPSQPTADPAPTPAVVAQPHVPEPTAPPQPAQPEPAPPMTRRERREQEERERAAAEALNAGSSVTPGEVAPIPDPLPQPRPAPVAPEAAVDQPAPVSAEAVVEAQPLPPVFEPTGPSTTPGPVVFDDGTDEDFHLAESREVSAGHPTTHALVLPTTPTVDIAGPIGDTGEVLVTGQITLPPVVVEKGLQGRLEEEENFDQLIGAETAVLTAPVSATSAVSSKGDDREFQMVRKAPWGTAATALAASAVLLVLAAAGLVTVALLTDLMTWPF